MQVLAAQLCYLVAGLRPSPLELPTAAAESAAASAHGTKAGPPGSSGARYCLLGGACVALPAGLEATAHGRLVIGVCASDSYGVPG